ncbi:MAG: C1 family peptidase, partial [Nanobdellota archaeon]
LLVILLICTTSVYAIGNPAAEFCTDNGNDYRKRTDSEGNEFGVCIVDGNLVDAWEHFRKNKGSKEEKTFSLMSTDEEPEGLKFKQSTSEPDITYEEDSLKVSSGSGETDYREGNWTTPVKNQGECGACWAFSVIGVADTMMNLNINDSDYDMDLSEQHLTSCDDSCYDSEHCQEGCSGGYLDLAFQFSVDNGILEESCFPYSESDEQCSNKCSDWENQLSGVDDYLKVNNNIDSVKYALDKFGPVSMAMEACEKFKNYTGGVYYNESEPDSCGGHAIVFVGYNDTGEYFIGKNSWGTSWGEDGYFRIHYNESAGDYTELKNTHKILYLDDAYVINNTDTDNDNFTDKEDNCPKTAGNNSGCPDTTPPTIHNITLSDYIFKNGSMVAVIVNATDNYSVSSVEAEGISLNQNGSIWKDNISLSEPPLEINATDINGNSVINDSVNFTIDDKAPEIDNISIEPKIAGNNTNISLAFDYREDHFREANITIEDKAFHLDNHTNNSMNFSYHVNGSLGEGNHSISMTIHDKAGNNRTRNSSLIIDLYGPVIGSIEPEKERVRTNDTIGIIVNITETFLKNVTANDEELDCNEELCNGTIKINKSTIEVFAEDILSNNTTMNETIIIDDKAPEINISAPSYHNSYYVPVNITSDENVTCKINDKDHELKKNTSHKRYIYSKNGSINASCEDLAGNPSLNNTSTIIDTERPEVNITINESGKYHNEPVLINITATDNNETKTARWYNNTWVNESEFVLDHSLEDDRLYYSAIDMAGNTAFRKSIELVYDDEKPKIWNISAERNLAPNQEFRIEIFTDGGTGNISLDNKTYELTEDMRSELKAPEEDGEYKADINISDLAGNTAGRSFNITVNSSVPSIIPNITNNSYIENNSLLEVNHTGEQAWYNISGKIENLTGSITINKTTNITFHSNNSEYNTTKEYRYIIDEKKPEIDITSHSNNSRINGTLDIRTNITDEAGIESRSLLIDDEPQQDFRTDTHLLTDGLHNFSVSAEDKTGNRRTLTYSFNITNTIEETFDTKGDPNSSTAYAENLSRIMVERIEGLNSSNITVKKKDIETDKLGKIIGRADINASTAFNSTIIATIPVSTGKDNITFYADHGNGLERAEFSYIDTAEYHRFSIKTEEYSDFVWGEYPSCPENIDYKCYCGDELREDGYCCSGDWQSSSCEDDTEDSSSPSGGGTSSGGGGLSPSVSEKNISEGITKTLYYPENGDIIDLSSYNTRLENITILTEEEFRKLEFSIKAGEERFTINSSEDIMLNITLKDLEGKTINGEEIKKYNEAFYLISEPGEFIIEEKITETAKTSRDNETENTTEEVNKSEVKDRENESELSVSWENQTGKKNDDEVNEGFSPYIIGAILLGLIIAILLIIWKIRR